MTPDLAALLDGGPSLNEIARHAPVVLRVIVGGLGVVLWAAGARVYKRGLFMASFVAGALAVVWLLAIAATALPVLGQPMVLGTASVIAGLVCVGVAAAAHRLALVAVGAIAGITGGAAVLTMLPLGAVGWWWPLPAGLLGALLFPLVFPLVLRILTPLLGAMAVAWAAGYPANLPLLALGWGTGVVVQTIFRPKKAKPAPEPA